MAEFWHPYGDHMPGFRILGDGEKIKTPQGEEFYRYISGHHGFGRPNEHPWSGGLETVVLVRRDLKGEVKPIKQR